MERKASWPEPDVDPRLHELVQERGLLMGGSFEAAVRRLAIEMALILTLRLSMSMLVGACTTRRLSTREGTQLS